MSPKLRIEDTGLNRAIKEVIFPDSPGAEFEEGDGTYALLEHGGSVVLRSPLFSQAQDLVSGEHVLAQSVTLDHKPVYLLAEVKGEKRHLRVTREDVVHPSGNPERR